MTSMAAGMKTGTKLGLLACSLAVATVMLWFYLTRQVSLPDDRSLFVVAFLAAAALGVLAFVKGTSLPGALPPLAAIVIGLFLPFTISISKQTVEADRVIAVGDVIPRFSALDGQGATFNSDALHGHLVLIKFFRAHW